MREAITTAGERSTDRLPEVFVGAVWVGMAAALFAYVWRYGANVPWQDDWALVSTLSHAQPLTGGWLWMQQNEHRFPVSKLILYALGEATGGDYRAAQLFTATLLVGVTLAGVVAARRMRGHTTYADAFFPLVLLHWGHQQNLLHHIQLFFVSAAALPCVIVLLIVGDKWPRRRGAAVGLAVCLVLLPLHGALGLAYLPPLAGWALWAGAGMARSRESGRTGRLLFGGALGALAVGAAYMYGYHRVQHHPPSPSLKASAVGMLEVLSVSLGPFGKRLWPWSAVLVLAVCLFTVALLLWVIATRTSERRRAAGLLLAMVAIGSFAGAVGFGRAGFGPGFGFGGRYALLAAPLLWCCYYAWGLYARFAAGGFLQTCLFFVATLALPVNFHEGRAYGVTRREQADALERDVRAGMPPRLLAASHFAAFYADQEFLREGLRTLQQARRGPYKSVAGAPAFDCSTRQRVDPEVVAVNDVEWHGERAIGRGFDPYVVYAVPAGIVCAIELRYTLTNADGKAARLTLFWAQTGVNAFTDAERTWSTSVTPAAHEQRATVWINDRIDRVRVDPDDRPVEFHLSGITLFKQSPRDSR